MLAGLDDARDFLVARDVVLQLFEAGWELGAGPPPRFDRHIVPLPPLRVDALKFHLPSRPIEALADQPRMSLGDPANILGGRLAT